MSDTPMDRKQLVTLARELERLMARARKISAQLDEVHARIRTHRKLLRDLTEVTAADLYRPVVAIDAEGAVTRLIDDEGRA